MNPKKRKKLKMYPKGIEVNAVYAEPDKKTVTKIFEIGRHRIPFVFEPITSYEIETRFREMERLRKKLAEEKDFEIVEVLELKKGHTVRGKKALVWKERQAEGYSLTQIKRQWNKVKKLADEGNPETMREYNTLRKMIGEDMLPKHLNPETVEKQMKEFYDKVNSIRERIKKAFSESEGFSEQHIELAHSNYVWDPKRKKFIVVDVIRPDEYTGF